jgi:protease I
LEQQGWTAHIISPESGTIRAWAEKDWGKEYTVDKTLDEANASDYDALVLPGGVINPDQLRTNETALSFVRDFSTAETCGSNLSRASNPDQCGSC